MNKDFKYYVAKTLKILGKCLFVCFIVISIFCFVLIALTLRNCRNGYPWEKEAMTEKLESIQNVKVLNVWGHEDISLEEISTRITVSDTNEIVLHHLSYDVFDYPRTVYISEINGKKLTAFYPDTYGCYLNIGTESIIGRELGIVFNTPADVIQNIDKIDNFFNNLKPAPNLNYFCDSVVKKQMYLGIEYKKGDDRDPLYILYDCGNKMEFARSLDWKDFEVTE